MMAMTYGTDGSNDPLLGTSPHQVPPSYGRRRDVSTVRHLFPREIGWDCVAEEALNNCRVGCYPGTMKSGPLRADRAAITRRVETSAAALHAEIDPDACRKLVQWIELLVAWNKKIDLTAARTIDELVDLCIADAMVLAQGIPCEQSVIDVGSGAGAPGLPLAVIRPDLAVTLVEPLAKRVSFLRTAIGSIGMLTLVQRERGEAAAEANGRFDVAVSRATLEPAAWLDLGKRLCHPQSGKVAVLLARQSPPLGDSVVSCVTMSYKWPLTGVDRTIAWYSWD